MRALLICVIGIVTFSSCDQAKDDQVYEPEPGSFVIDISSEQKALELIKTKQLECLGCYLKYERIDGLTGFKLTTQVQFSDAVFDLKSLFGRTYDITESNYLSYRIYVPSDSWIGTLNFNYFDTLESVGGCAINSNNFPGNYDRWRYVLVDLKQHTQDSCRVWNGDTYPFTQVSRLSVNPYNGNLIEPSSIYFNDIRLTKEPPENTYLSPLFPLPDTTSQPFKISFEDEQQIRKMIVHRTYESNRHALKKNISNNPNWSLRSKGRYGEINYFTFKPYLITGHPVDFTKVTRIYFTYYLTNESDDVITSRLHLAKEGWQNSESIDDFYQTFTKGSWNTVSVDLTSFNLRDSSVLHQVSEIKLDIIPEDRADDVEIWLDNFGWE